MTRKERQDQKSKQLKTCIGTPDTHSPTRFRNESSNEKGEQVTERENLRLNTVNEEGEGHERSMLLEDKNGLMEGTHRNGNMWLANLTGK